METKRLLPAARTLRVQKNTAPQCPRRGHDRRSRAIPGARGWKNRSSDRVDLAAANASGRALCVEQPAQSVTSK